MEQHKKRMKISLLEGNQSAVEGKGQYAHDHGNGHGLKTNNKSHLHDPLQHPGNVRQNQVGSVMLFGVPIVSLVMEGKERLCLAQISSTLLKEFSYNEIHNRRVALGITCIQCTPVQLEILRRAGAMPVTSRRCGMITRREAERLCQSFLGDHAPPQLPENFAFNVFHECAWGCRGAFVPARYNSSRAKCIRCSFCQLFFSPNKFIFHSHRLPDSHYVQPDAANFNSWRRHLKLCGDAGEDVGPTSANYLQPIVITPKDGAGGKDASAILTAQIVHAWEDVKAMFNGGTRKRLLAAQCTTPASTGMMKGIGHAHSHSHSTKLNSNSSGANAPGQGHGNSHSAATPQSSRQSQQHFLHHMTNSNAGLQSSAPVGSTPPTFMSPVLPVPTPLLSPSGIWNPGISAPRQVVPTMPLSIHPLSIPWLRRPLFPFSHPFGPTCKFLSGDAASCGGESCGGGGLNSSSAFKPVGVNLAPRHQTSCTSATTAAEHLFSTWLSNSVNLTSNSILPEDLSVSTGSGGTPSPKIEVHHDFDVKNNIAGKHSSNDDSSEEENVDIESTGAESDKSNVSKTNGERSNKIQSQVEAGETETVDVEEEVDVLEEEDDVSLSPLPPVTLPAAESTSVNHGNGGDGNTGITPRKLLATSGLSASGKKVKKRLWDFDRD